MADLLAHIKQLISTLGKKPNPCLTEEQVEAFEARHGVRLPEEYRRFLLQVGNGGDGPPHYGLVRLGAGPKAFDREARKYWEALPNLAMPFPFTEPWVWEDGDLSSQGTLEHVTFGSLFLGTDGCAMDWHLIVTGPERGKIWQFCGEGIVPTAPSRDFLSWYSDWLNGVTNWWE